MAQRAVVKPRNCVADQFVCVHTKRVLNSLSEPFRNCWSGCHVQCKWGSMNSVWQDGVNVLVKLCGIEEALAGDWIYQDSLIAIFYVPSLKHKELERCHLKWPLIEGVLYSLAARLQKLFLRIYSTITILQWMNYYQVITLCYIVKEALSRYDRSSLR